MSRISICNGMFHSRFTLNECCVVHKKNLVPAVAENLLTRIFKCDVFMNGNVYMCTQCHADLYL